MKTLNGVVGTAVALVTVAMMASTPAMAQEVYLQGGTQGGGGGVAIGLTNFLGVHADLDGFNFSKSFNAGGNKFDGDIHVRHAGLYLDLFPFSGSGFRVTAGALFNRDRINAVAVPTDGNYTVNHVQYPAALFPGQTISATARFPTVMPYAGLGWGHKPVSKGFGFVADIGVAYGRPIVGYSVPALLQQIAPTNVAQQEADIRSTIQKVKIYPVVQIGISYHF